MLKHFGGLIFLLKQGGIILELLSSFMSVLALAYSTLYLSLFSFVWEQWSQIYDCNKQDCHFFVFITYDQSFVVNSNSPQYVGGFKKLSLNQLSVLGFKTGKCLNLWYDSKFVFQLVLSLLPLTEDSLNRCTLAVDCIEGQESLFIKVFLSTIFRAVF